MNDAIAFKTRMTGMTTVPINADNLNLLDEALTDKMRAAPKDFFKASPFIADLQEASSLSLSDLAYIKNTFAKHGLLLVGLTNHSLDMDLLTQAGLANIANHHDSALQLAPSQKPTTSSATKPLNKVPSPTNSQQGNVNSNLASLVNQQSVLENLSAKTKIVKRHIRSGQRLYAPEGDLVIIGIVGAGAEIIADGNIFILGSLRGRAFAGAKGNTAAFIYAQELSAELVSIAGNYQTMEQLEVYKNSQNTLITLSEDETMQIKAL